MTDHVLYLVGLGIQTYHPLWRATMRLLLAVMMTNLILAGCASSGPGVACSPCEQATAAADASGTSSQAAAAAARGGQEASNNPQQGDNVPLKPLTVVSSGAGAATVNPTQTDTRSQAGAPSVNQGLVLPASADARTGGGVSPVVASLQSYIDDLRASLKMAMLDPTAPPDKVNRIMEAINAAVGQMAQAQASAQASTHNTFNLQGAVVTQTVANGSNSGDGQTAIDPANAKALADGLLETVKAAGAARAPLAPISAPAAPDAPSAPPAGAPQPEPVR